MRDRIAVGAALAMALLISSAWAADAVKSGPQVGSSKLLPFNPLHCNGSGVGEKACLV
jgi:hypothetical protein